MTHAPIKTVAGIKAMLCINIYSVRMDVTAVMHGSHKVSEPKGVENPVSVPPPTGHLQKQYPRKDGSE